MNLQQFWDFMGNADALLGVIALIFTIMIWSRQKEQAAKLKEMAMNMPKLNSYEKIRDWHEGISSESPKAFCLSLIPNQASIKLDVERFLTSKSMTMPIVELNEDGIKTSEVRQFIEKLRAKRRVELASATEIHLFLQGPVQAGILIGAAFDNWIPIKLYQFNREIGTYEYWGHLTK